MERKRVWKEKYRIHSYEMNIKGEATLPILCNFMQESAWHHAENLGVGFLHLSKNGLIWVLSRQLIQIEEFPKWGETITIHTWPSGKERFAYIRDFKILNQTEKTIGKARTKWFALDLKRKRPQNVDSYFKYDLTGVEQAFSHQLAKLGPVGANKISKNFQVDYLDLDVNEHVNNVKYIEWLMDSFPLEFHKLNLLKELEINFLAETFYNDHIKAFTEKRENSHYFHGLIRERDQTEICRAKTCWRAIHV